MSDLLNGVTVGAGDGAGGLPAGHTVVLISLHLLRKLQQQEVAQSRPINTALCLDCVQVQQQSTLLLSDHHAVKQEPVLLPGAVTHRGPGQVHEVSSGQGARFTTGVLDRGQEDGETLKQRAS